MAGESVSESPELGSGARVRSPENKTPKQNFNQRTKYKIQNLKYRAFFNVQTQLLPSS